MRPAPVERLLAAIACAAACAAGAAQFDTLFHSPQERERLDRLRRGEAAAAAADPGTPASRRRELTGYVKRSDGRSTAFIDGEAVPVDPRSAPALEPEAVRSYAGRPPNDDLRIERKDPR